MFTLADLPGCATLNESAFLLYFKLADALSEVQTLKEKLAANEDRLTKYHDLLYDKEKFKTLLMVSVHSWNAHNIN